jgi:hypothetical protein
MKWIKTFETFNFDFDLYTELNYLQYRELSKRKIIEPTEDKLEEIYQVLQNNTKKEITNPKLGNDVDHVQQYLYKNARRDFDVDPDFYFYEVDLYKSHVFYGTRSYRRDKQNNYLYVIEIPEKFYLILYSIIPDGKKSIYRNPFYFICDDLVGIKEFVEKELNLRKFELEEFP